MRKYKSTTGSDTTGKPKANWMLLLMLAVLCVCIFCGYGAARMRSASEEADSARVAAYVANASLLSSGDISIDCNEGGNTTTQYEFQVRNTKGGTTSEVSMKYDVQVTLNKALPTGVTMKVDGQDGDISTDGMTYTYTNTSWAFGASNGDSNNHTLEFEADPEIVTFNTDDIQITIHVLTRQTD